MIYIVTDGDYSEYSICGVFTDRDEAKKFQEYHNYSEVEEHEINPEVPQYNNLRFHCSYYLNEDRINVFRIDNKETEKDRRTRGQIVLDSYDDSVLIAYIWAKTEEQAHKIWQDKLNAARAGSLFVHRQVRRAKSLNPKDGNELVEEVLVWTGRQFQVVSEETE